jgi:MazG family protein
MANPWTFEDLVRVMDRLREPGGCPWDREQRYETLRSYVLEECYEVVEAIDRGQRDDLREELGDLLFQIVFLSRLAAEEGAFGAADVVRGIGEKIVRRHPHVFGDGTADTSEEVLRNWEEIKRKEKENAGASSASVLAGIPTALPALLKAQRLGTKASRVGFDWRGPEEVLEKVEEEIAELREAVARADRQAAHEELGDALFSLVMLGRHMGVDPEAALEATNAKFRQRFTAIETQLGERGVKIEEAGFELLDRLWDELKATRGSS